MTFEEIDARHRAAALTVASADDEWDDPETTPEDDDDRDDVDAGEEGEDE